MTLQEGYPSRAKQRARKADGFTRVCWTSSTIANLEYTTNFDRDESNYAKVVSNYKAPWATATKVDVLVIPCKEA